MDCHRAGHIRIDDEPIETKVPVTADGARFSVDGFGQTIATAK